MNYEVQVKQIFILDFSTKIKSELENFCSKINVMIGQTGIKSNL